MGRRNVHVSLENSAKNMKDQFVRDNHLEKYFGDLQQWDEMLHVSGQLDPTTVVEDAYNKNRNYQFSALIDEDDDVQGTLEENLVSSDTTEVAMYDVTDDGGQINGVVMASRRADGDVGFVFLPQ